MGGGGGHVADYTPMGRSSTGRIAAQDALQKGAVRITCRGLSADISEKCDVPALDGVDVISLLLHAYLDKHCSEDVLLEVTESSVLLCV